MLTSEICEIKKDFSQNLADVKSSICPNDDEFREDNENMEGEGRIFEDRHFNNENNFDIDESMPI